jgi:Tol biopolymer transport system component
MSPAPFDGRLMLMTFPSQLYVTEPGVSSFRLEGIAVWLASFWSPDGGYFIAIGEEGDARSGPSGHAYVYLLTPGENTAIKLDTKTATGGYALPRPSPDGALVMYSEGDRLAIVDVKARTIRRLPLSLGGLASTSIPIWSDDGRYISYGEAVIDVQNGTFVRAPSSGGGEVSSRVSPDGTWLVASSPSYIDEGEQPDCPLIEPTFAANRTRIISLRDNSERSVLVCEDMAFSPWQWLDDSHVLMTGSSCRTCREKRLEWLLLDVRNGSAQTLAVDSRGGFAFDTQEDGSVIVGGNITSEPFGALHIYEAIGRPIRHIDSPDGAPVRTVAWSPDGDAFVFVTGPEADLSQFYRSGP